jgi:hypothetical protein
MLDSLSCLTVPARLSAFTGPGGQRLEKHSPAEQGGGIAKPQVKLRPITFSVDRRKPERIQLRVLGPAKKRGKLQALKMTYKASAIQKTHSFSMLSRSAVDGVGSPGDVGGLIGDQER